MMLRWCGSGRALAIAAIACILASATSACSSPLGPSCREEQGTVLDITGSVPANGTATYVVVSPKPSNLIMRLTWNDTETTLRLGAAIIDCGGHPGCAMMTSTPPPGPGGPSPTPLPWPPGLREMRVDGWQGKTYRIEITGELARETNFALSVVYDISCES